MLLSVLHCHRAHHFHPVINHSHFHAAGPRAAARRRRLGGERGGGAGGGGERISKREGGPFEEGFGAYGVLEQTHRRPPSQSITTHHTITHHILSNSTPTTCSTRTCAPTTSRRSGGSSTGPTSSRASRPPSSKERATRDNRYAHTHTLRHLRTRLRHICREHLSLN